MTYLSVIPEEREVKGLKFHLDFSRKPEKSGVPEEVIVKM
jgi:hypothetical protein